MITQYQISLSGSEMAFKGQTMKTSRGDQKINIMRCEKKEEKKGTLSGQFP
jgi:hypothetical protein